MDVPSQGRMKAEEVGESTTGDVADAVDIADGEGGITSGCVQQVNDGVAVNLRRVEQEFTKGDIALGPTHQGAMRMLSVKGCNIGVGQTCVINDFANQGIPVGVDAGRW